MRANQSNAPNPDPNAGRVACPRCLAVNFAGQPQCWQCHAPLPPPGFTAFPVPGDPIPMGQPSGWTRLGRGVVVIGIAAVSFVVALRIMGGVEAPDAPPANSPAVPSSPALSTRETANLEGESLRRDPSPSSAMPAPGIPATETPASPVPAAPLPNASETPLPVTDTPGTTNRPVASERAADAASSDPLARQAQRELQRAKEELNLTMPPSASGEDDNRIRLRGGGSIRRDEWEAARRRALSSPVVRAPPLTPP